MGRRAVLRVAIATVGLLAVCAAVVFMAVVDAKLRAIGRGDLSQFTPAAFPMVLGALSAATVGLVLVARRDGHIVGWLLMGLAVAVMLAGLMDEYASYARITHATSNLGRGAEYFTGATFVPLLTFLSLILMLTPTGRPLNRRWRWVARAAVVVPSVYVVARALGNSAPEPPYEHVSNPFAVDAIGGALAPLRVFAGLLMPLIVIAAAISLVLRFRRSVGDERQQLRWVVFGGALTGVGVLGSLVGVLTHHPAVTNVAVGFFVTLLPVFTGIAISKDRLYDLDRLISRTVVYAAVTGAVAASYTVIVLIASTIAGALGAGTGIPIVLATLVAISVLNPARRWVQDVVDRRFNRRRYDALKVIDAFVRRPLTATHDGDDIEAVLRRALGDPGLQVAYYIDGRDGYVSGAGEPVDVGDGGFRVERDGATIAVLHHSDALTQHDVVAAAAGAAAPELQAARLRAEITLQLVEVEESRARIVAAASAERKRIERNLHDGAQQRLVALVIQLRLAQRTLDSEAAKAVVAAAADEIQGANQDLRELAHGLHPSILTDAGLRRALEQLGERAPFPVTVNATEERLPPDVELAAYFITAEAIANAGKHAEASAMTVDATLEGNDLVLVVRDDGRGGADPTSSGLIGLADRAAALRGTLSIDSPPGGGTTIVARLPCGAAVNAG